MRDDATSGERAEFSRRLTLVRQAMTAEGFDAVVSGDSGDWLQPSGDARYLSNFNVGNLVNAVPGSIIVVGSDLPPTLIVAASPEDSFLNWARATAWVDDVRAPAAGRTMLDEVVDTIESAIGTHERIGIGGDFAGSSALPARLPHAEVVSTAVVDGAGIPRTLIERVRRRKSEWELVRMRRAQSATQRAMSAFMSSVRPGLRHLEASAHADAAGIEAGGERSLTLMNSGSDPWMWWHIQGDRRFATGRIVTLETNVAVEGYVAQFARSGVLGTASAAQERIRRAAEESIAEMVRAIRPGATGHDVWAAGVAPVRESGLRPWGRLGHGMGLSMDEGFAVVEHDDHPFEPGDCLAVHASVWDEDSRESYLLGEQYEVVADGAEALAEGTPQRDLAPLAN